MTLINNERAKLTATYLNGLAVALAAVGGLAPIFSSLTASTSAAAPGWVLLSSSVACLLGSGALHGLARLVLRGLKL